MQHDQQAAHRHTISRVHSTPRLMRIPPARRRYTDGIPGKAGLPLLNEDLLFVLKPGRNGLAVLSQERRRKYGDIYRHRMINEVVLSVGGLENVKKLLAAEHVLVEGTSASLPTRCGYNSSSPQFHASGVGVY